MPRPKKRPKKTDKNKKEETATEILETARIAELPQASPVNYETRAVSGKVTKRLIKEVTHYFYSDGTETKNEMTYNPNAY